MDNTTPVTTMGGESPGNEAQEGDHVELAMEHHETPDGGMQNGTGTMGPTGTGGGLSLVRWIRGGNGRRGNQGGNNQGNSRRGEQGGNNQDTVYDVGLPPPPYSANPANLQGSDYELTDPPPSYDSMPILGGESRLVGNGDQLQLVLLPRYGVDGETASGHPAGRMSLVMGGAARRIEEAQNADAVRRGPEEEEEDELVFRCCHSGVSASTYCGFFVWALIIIVILAAMFGIGFVYGRDYEKGLNNDSGGGNNSSSPAAP
ncbi:hypothetical protein [Candidatus Ichthyocystis sparus]|uniref:hypothetical protein n=1 Tax=Candidatus Ichthyocystis sparus TaxID=1561004 RepID=UPI000B81DE69|nr:hypothetical protein [Candidatus Ichthyocystis sparus]